ncbi:hypothetical protein I7I51_04266 [Histoplasma capsulatum]|uniref:Uncharacterized protein n=1 Tax=Ajellomyces capsulatus TaxID=5037 RepID=A0A8A1M7V1_AJECA|nr:hypothetical protein I7I51_04266 [Histoplasma capsulatum]
MNDSRRADHNPSATPKRFKTLSLAPRTVYRVPGLKCGILSSLEALHPGCSICDGIELRVSLLSDPHKRVYWWTVIGIKKCALNTASVTTWGFRPSIADWLGAATAWHSRGRPPIMVPRFAEPIAWFEKVLSDKETETQKLTGALTSIQRED